LPLNLDIRPVALAQLAIYAEIPSTFEVNEVLDVTTDLDGSYVLTSRPSLTPYTKDYDAANGGPAGWAMRFDMTNWAILIAYVGDRAVGGAAAAVGWPELDLLNNAADSAVLWDIRVAPDMRRQGIATELFKAIETWAAGQRCSALVIETQNVNVAACRFYESAGCTLRKIRDHAYLDVPDEIQLLWDKRFEFGLDFKGFNA